MSRQATDWLGENLATVNRTQFTNGAGLGNDGLVLLFYFCDRANKAGELFMQIRTMMEETSLAMSSVKRLLAQFQEIGWLTDTGQTMKYRGRGKATPVYLLTCVPEITQEWATGTSIGTCTAPDTDSKANDSKGFQKEIGLETELQLQPEPEPQLKPEPQPQPEPSSGEGKGGKIISKEWGKEHDQLLSGCLAWERANYEGTDQGWLEKSWLKDYRPLVITAIDTKPQTDLVAWCVERRWSARGYGNPSHKHTAPGYTVLATTSAPASMRKANPHCPDCKGNGYIRPYDEATKSYPTTKICACTKGEPTQDTTPEKVDIDQEPDPFGDTPPPQAQTDAPLAPVVRALTNQFRHTA